MSFENNEYKINKYLNSDGSIDELFARGLEIAPPDEEKAKIYARANAKMNKQLNSDGSITEISVGGGVETDPIYAADKSNIALNSIDNGDDTVTLNNGDGTIIIIPKISGESNVYIYENVTPITLNATPQAIINFDNLQAGDYGLKLSSLFDGTGGGSITFSVFEDGIQIGNSLPFTAGNQPVVQQFESVKPVTFISDTSIKEVRAIGDGTITRSTLKINVENQLN